MVFKVLKESFAQLLQNYYKLEKKVSRMNPHHRAGGQPTSQVCQCNFTCMHCVRVGCFDKTLGSGLLCSLGVWLLLSFALHRSKQK